MSNTETRKQLLDSRRIEEAILRLTETIGAEFFSGTSPLEGDDLPAILGIQAGGIPLARRLAKHIRDRYGVDLPSGTLDIVMYRDDFGTRKSLPLIRETAIPFELNRRPLILVDDVLQSGRTIRAALDAVTDYGRPSKIRLAVLVDRGGREFPITADYAGVTLQVPDSAKVRLDWTEYDGPSDEVYMTSKQ